MALVVFGAYDSYTSNFLPGYATSQPFLAASNPKSRIRKKLKPVKRSLEKMSNGSALAFNNSGKV